MQLIALLCLFGWAVYSPAIAVALGVMCGVIAIFYAGIFDGPADEKTLKTFSILVICMSIVMVGAFSGHIDGDAPRMCARVEC